MKESIQNKIDQIKALARTQNLAGNVGHADVADREDSLLKVIRNKDEANVFMAELDAVIKMAIARR